jgi:hypothetical protein
MTTKKSGSSKATLLGGYNFGFYENNMQLRATISKIQFCDLQ